MHVVVLKCNNGVNATTVTCKRVVLWVLGAAGTIRRVDCPNTPSSNHNNDNEAAHQSRARAEWNKGEEGSAATATIPWALLSLLSLWRHLNPSYWHNPMLLSQLHTTANGESGDPPLLVASELLALGSVWRLRHDTPGDNNRFDLSCGSRPTRLDVGNANLTAFSGGYFWVHFDPRRIDMIYLSLLL